MGTKIFVGNLSFDTGEVDLRTHFQSGGFTVEKVSVVMDRETGRPRGFAFVEMASADDAAKAMAALDGKELQGRPLRVNQANDRPKDGGGFGRSGGFGGKRRSY
jgi:RNA recognition motif-containing protein